MSAPLLQRLAEDLAATAKSSHCELAVSDTLIIFPIGCPTSTLLKVGVQTGPNGETRLVLIQHRHWYLTEKYANRTIDADWVLGFLNDAANKQRAEVIINCGKPERRRLTQEQMEHDRLLEAKREREWAEAEKLRLERIAKNEKIIAENMRLGLQYAKDDRSNVARVSQYGYLSTAVRGADYAERAFGGKLLYPTDSGCRCGSGRLYIHCCGAIP